MSYQYTTYPFTAPPGLTAPEPKHQVVIIGAGPVGLSLAIDLAQRGVASVVLDDNNVVSVGSRAICWAKRTLEIFHRLGVGKRMLEKGVTWKTGRLFHGADEVYHFDLMPEPGFRFPAFINLQQYYVEEYLVERAQEFPSLIDLRFKNRVVDHKDHGSHVTLDVETPQGNYELEAICIVACDGANSPTRNRMGLTFEGQDFDEHFLIIDVELEQSPFGDGDAERWFWFEPTFHAGQSALLHKQPDNIYRIDLQLSPDADPVFEAQMAQVEPRLKAILRDREFRVDWNSVYKFRCAKLEKMVHGRVIFAGDSAHVVSPFGARGGNGGIQDIDNLGWKLAAIVGGANPDLLQDYDRERCAAAVENLQHSARATSFMTPKSKAEMNFRQEILNLATGEAFARRLINSGRLSKPARLPTVDRDTPRCVGFPVIDLPLTEGRFLIDELNHTWCVLACEPVDPASALPLPVIPLNAIARSTHIMSARYAANGFFLVRPDGYICTYWQDQPTVKQINQHLDPYKKKALEDA